MIKDPGEATKAAIHGYQFEVASMGHAAIAPWPVVAKTHASLAQFLEGSSKYLADQILSYLYRTRDFSFTYNAKKEEFEIYVDASHADHQDNMSSQEALVMMYGGVLDRKVAKQKTVASSSTEAEPLAFSSVAGYSNLWIRLFKHID